MFIMIIFHLFARTDFLSAIVPTINKVLTLGLLPLVGRTQNEGV